HEWNQNLQPFARADLQLVLSGPLQRVSGGQLQVSCDRRLRRVHIAADVARDRIDVHVPGELSVFVAHHRRTGGHRDLRELTERDTRAHGRLDKHALQRWDALAERTRVAHIHRISFTSLNRLRHVLPTEAGLDHILDVLDGESMPGDGLTIDADVGEIALRDSLGIDAPGAWHLLENAFYLLPESLDQVEIRPENLDAHWRLDPGEQHVQPIANGLCPDIGEARE